MTFSPPKVFVFFLALVFAVFAIIGKFNLIPDFPTYIVDQAFWLALAAYVLMLLGNVTRSL